MLFPGKRLLAALLLSLGATRSTDAFNVSGFEFPDPDRSLGRHPVFTEREPTYREVQKSYRHARDAVVSTQRSLSVVELLGQTLTGEALALFEQIPAEKRASYDQALAAMLESHAQIRARSQDLERRLGRLTEELGRLRLQIFQTEGGQLRLRGEIAALQSTADELREEERRIDAELPAVSGCEEFARELALALDRELAAERRDYWTEIGRYFRDRNLGAPVDYAAPLQPLPVQTERRVEVHDERRAPPVAVAAIPAGPAAVVAEWGRAFPVAVAARPPLPVASGGDEAAFRERLARCVAAQQECQRLAGRADTALIESAQARHELKEHLAAARAAEAERNFATDALARLRSEVGWKAWELEQRTSGARELLGSCVTKAKEKARWFALKEGLKRSLENPATARTMYAHLHLANEVTKAVGQAPDAIARSDDPAQQAERDRLLAIDEKSGRTFVREAWGVKERPLPLQRMFEKLFGPTELKQD